MRLLTIISLSLLSLNLIGQVPEKPNAKIADSVLGTLESTSLKVDSTITTEISNVVALNYKEATNLFGKTVKDTAMYITTRKLGKQAYCSLFRTKPGAFNLFTSSTESDKMIESIVNGEPYSVYTDSKYLFLATDQNFKAFDAIDKDGISIGQKRYILLITNKLPKKLIKASKK
jgi:hypothetical protein